MVTSLLILPILWIVTAAGRTIAAWLRLPDTATRLERNLIGCGLGLGLLAYGILALGLLGLLYPLAGLLWVLVLALLGGRQHLVMAQEGRAWKPGRLTAVGWASAALFAVFGLVALAGVYSPPVVFIPGVNATEWDSLSYHLADPKLFLQGHRIASLPWQPHSNFAFTAEMWYTLALMAHGSLPLAKWFSWICAAGTTLCVYSLGSRHLSPQVGLLAALFYAATPLVFWEAGTAYIDGATAFFATLALLCVLLGMRESQSRWLWAGAVLAGFALSTKATALAPLLCLALGVLLWGWQTQGPPRQALMLSARWSALALIVGAPWYVKAWICTGNPLYPYFYSLFGGRWWGPTWARAYASANNPGFGHSAAAALQLPWTLTLAIVPGHPLGAGQPFNEFPSPLLALLPVLLGALFFPAFSGGTIPRVVKALGAYALTVTLLWFTQTQYIRFLLMIVPVYCLLAAWTLRSAVAARTFSGYALSALAAVSVIGALLTGISLASAEGPVALGMEPQISYLARYDLGYGTMQFINQQLPPGSKIAFFGYTFGLYCNRPYLWGDQSAYVLTPGVHSPAALLSRLHQLGVTEVLVNANTPQSGLKFAPGGGVGGWLYAVTAAREMPLYPGPNDPNRGILLFAVPPHL